MLTKGGFGLIELVRMVGCLWAPVLNHLCPGHSKAETETRRETGSVEEDTVSCLSPFIDHTVSGLRNCADIVILF